MEPGLRALREITLPFWSPAASISGAAEQAGAGATSARVTKPRWSDCCRTRCKHDWENAAVRRPGGGGGRGGERKRLQGPRNAVNPDDRRDSDSGNLTSPTHLALHSLDFGTPETATRGKASLHTPQEGINHYHHTSAGARHQAPGGAQRARYTPPAGNSSAAPNQDVDCPRCLDTDASVNDAASVPAERTCIRSDSGEGGGRGKGVAVDRGGLAGSKRDRAPPQRVRADLLQNFDGKGKFAPELRRQGQSHAPRSVVTKPGQGVVRCEWEEATALPVRGDPSGRWPMGSKRGASGEWAAPETSHGAESQIGGRGQTGVPWPSESRSVCRPIVGREGRSRRLGLCGRGWRGGRGAILNDNEDDGDENVLPSNPSITSQRGSQENVGQGIERRK